MPRARPCQGSSKTSSPLSRGSGTPARASSISASWRSAHAPAAGTATPIMQSRVTSPASSASLQPSVPVGLHREHEVANLRGRVPHADLDVVAELEAELAQHRSRLGDHAGAVGRALVPVRRQAEHRPGVAGAKRADDRVVSRGRVLEHDHGLALGAGEPELGDRRRAVLRAGAACTRDRPTRAQRPWRRSAARRRSRTARRRRRSHRSRAGPSRRGGLRARGPAARRPRPAAGGGDGGRDRGRDPRSDCSAGSR